MKEIIGETPTTEDWTRVEDDDPNYLLKARKECKALINQLRRQFGPEPSGCKLIIDAVSYKDKVYLCVCIDFDPDNAEAVNYYNRVDKEMPSYWDSLAKEELI